MGRTPCCDKANVKKGPWSPDEDAKLKAYIDQHGTGGNWIALPQKIGLKRCGKSCRLRWLNYLRPNIKHGGFSEEEDNLICSLYISIGSRWSVIAAQLPGRTDNDIKNYWNTRLKKKLFGKHRKEHQAAHRSNTLEQQYHVRMNRDMLNSASTAGTTATAYSSDMILSLADSSSIDQFQHDQMWPEFPVLSTPVHREPCFNNNDHESMIRKLLIKLGGNFSDDHYEQQAAKTSMASPSSYNSSTITTTTTTTTCMNRDEAVGLKGGSQIGKPQSHGLDHEADEGAGNMGYNLMLYFQGGSESSCKSNVISSRSSTTGAFFMAQQEKVLEEMVCVNSQRLDNLEGLEFLYSDDEMLNYDGKIMGAFNSSSSSSSAQIYDHSSILLNAANSNCCQYPDSSSGIVQQELPLIRKEPHVPDQEEYLRNNPTELQCRAVHF